MEGEREGKGRGGEGRQERGGTPARKRHPPVLPDSLCKALGSQWGGPRLLPTFSRDAQRRRLRHTPHPYKPITKETGFLASPPATEASGSVHSLP